MSTNLSAESLENTDRLLSFAEVPIGALLDLQGDLEPVVQSLRQRLEEAQERLNAVEAEILLRMQRDNATLLAHDGITVEVIRGTPTYERDPDVLKDLKPIVSASDFAAFYKVIIRKPEVKINLHHRKTIEKYGAAAQAILARGLRAIPGKPSLRFRRPTEE